MHAHDAERGKGPPRPRFANFAVCALESCEGLCYDHHPYRDSRAPTLNEIRACICLGDCLKEKCHYEKCSCFWKLQNEIINLRERMASTAERHRLKCANYKAEINSLRASIQPQAKTCFSDEVLRIFSARFQDLDRFENQVKDDFVMTICRFEQLSEANKKELAKEKEEKKKLEKCLARLQAEVNDLKRSIVLQVQQTPRTFGPY